MAKNKILKLIRSKLTVEHISIDDLTSKHQHHKQSTGGGHYKLIVVSNDFNNLTLIKRHKLIYTILKDMLQNEIHALSMITKTTKEYNNSK